MNTLDKLSIVVPVYNEEANLPQMFKRLCAAVDALDCKCELIFVNDGSADSSLELLRAEKKKRPDLIRVFDLSRNFGQHAAVIAGFSQAAGDLVITMDADLQNPPEEIHKIVAEFKKGHDYIGTIRQQRQDTFFRKTASRIMNNFVRRITGIHLNDFGCMLRGYSRRIVRMIVEKQTYRTFIPALGFVYAQSPAEIPVAHENRMAGKSNYSLLKLFNLQLDLIICFSLWPVGLLFFSGICICCLGTVLGVLILAMRLFFGVEWAVQGIFTLFAIVFIFVGLQFLCLGFIGEYIGRIYHKVIEKPVYVLKDEEQA